MRDLFRWAPLPWYALLSTCFVALLATQGCNAGKTKAVIDAGSVPVEVDAGTPVSSEPDAGVPDAGPGPDASTPDASTPDAVPAAVDAGPVDGGPVDGGPVDGGPVDGGQCGASAFNYVCSMSDPSTCPGGLCIVSLCLGPNVNQHQFDSCGNGACDACENAESCPADCSPPPVTTGTKEYDNDTTITVWVHGFTHVSDQAHMTYGGVKGCGDLGDLAKDFGSTRKCGDTPQTEVLPDNLVGVEYYGDLPAPWMTQADITEIEKYPYKNGPTGLQRFALVVGKFIRHRLEISHATHVNIACHSMGCLLSRYVIENDVEHLASQNKIVRWVTSAGVVAGARMAKLYDNPTLRQYADQLNLSTDDFALMNPDYVQKYAASWDHKLYEGNNPLLTGILIHHGAATDPNVPLLQGGTPISLRLLDVLPSLNTTDEADDGIMFTADEYFHTQKPAVAFHTPTGFVLPSTHSWTNYWHSDLPQQDGFHATAAAALFHRRKVIVTVKSITLKKGREFSLNAITEHGDGPSEVVVETQVSYDPYTVPAFNKKALVHDDRIAYRTAEMSTQPEGTTDTHERVIFTGPVFDAQQSFHLKATAVETDSYPRYKITEWAIPGDSDRELAKFDADVSLQDQSLHVDTQYATMDLSVQVVAMY